MADSLPTVTLWLSVYEKWCPAGASELWVRRMATHFAPRENDRVHLTVDEDGGGETSWTVRGSYWDHDGSYHVELTHIVVDPGDRQPFGDNYAGPWRTEQDGRPEPLLRRGGWTTYDEWAAANQADKGDHE